MTDVNNELKRFKNTNKNKIFLCGHDPSSYHVDLECHSKAHMLKA